MCRWLAYAGESRLIEQFVYDGPRSLCSQAQQSHKAKRGVHGDGGGLGWYGSAPEPGLYRRAGPAWADVNLRDLTRVVESRVFFAHVRASTGAPNIDINCHPFRAGSFMFMHNGQIGGFTQLRRHLTALLTDECFDALQGGSDSELLFQLMMTNGLREDTESAIRQSIVQVEKMRQEAGIAEAFRATFAITDGKHVWALRWSSDNYAPSLYLTQKHNGALIVSEPLDKDIMSWQKVSSDSLVRFDLHTDRVSVEHYASFVEGSV